MTARGFLGRFLRTLLLLNHFFVQVVRVLRRAFFVRTIARQTETLRVSFIMQDVASEETMEELKARVLSSSTYDKHMVPMQWEAKQEVNRTGARAPVNVTTHFIMDRNGLTIDQQSQTFSLKGHLRLK